MEVKSYQKIPAVGRSNSNSILFESPLHLAAVSCHMEKSQMESINPEIIMVETPIHLAAVSGHLENSQCLKGNK